MELRRLNSAAIAANNISLPPIQTISDILQHIHQTTIVEMGDSRSINTGSVDIIMPLALPPDSVAQSLDSLHQENAVHTSG